MPPKAPPLTIDELYEGCKGTLVSARDIRAMTRDECFQLCESRNEQIVFAKYFIQENCFISAPPKTLAVIFNITPSIVSKVLSKAKTNQKEIGRPLKINPDHEKIVVEEILAKRETYDFMSIGQIIDFIEVTFQKTVTKGWVNSFIFRHKNELAKTVIEPIDDSRLKVPRKFLQDFLDLIENIISITPAELIYNIDETGLSDWEERKSKTVVVPTELAKNKLNYPIDRRNKHVTLVVTISAGGDAYFPMAITSDPTLDQIFDLGIRRDTDLILQVSNSSYVNKQIFNNHIINNFIPQVEIDRKFVNLMDNPAILFFDNCSSHLDEELLQTLAQHMIIVIAYPSHTSHVFQVLDLLLFGVLKVHKKYLKKNDQIPHKIDHLYRIFQAYEQSTCSTTVRSAFRKAGFEYFEKDGLNYLKLNREKIEKSANFQEIWDFNYPEENLTPRRKKQKRGWINKEYFPEEFQQKFNLPSENQ